MECIFEIKELKSHLGGGGLVKSSKANGVNLSVTTDVGIFSFTSFP